MFLCTKEMQQNGLCRQGEIYTVTDNPKHPVQAAGANPAISGHPGSR
jgi:hypothetical protein